MKRFLGLAVLVVLAFPAFLLARESQVSAQPPDAEPMEVILYFVDQGKEPIRGRLLYFDEKRELYLIESADGSRRSVPWDETRRVVPFRGQGGAVGSGRTQPVMVTLHFRDPSRSPIIGRLRGFDERTLEFLLEEADGSSRRVPWDSTARIVTVPGAAGRTTPPRSAPRGLPESEDGAFTVSSLEDAGPGSLREALLAANHESGPNRIDFAVSGTISPTSPLPALSDETGGTTIDGRGIITLDGASMGTQSSGLAIHSANNVIAGLTITSFRLDGVQIRGPGASGNEIIRCRIGNDGQSARPNHRYGVLVSGGATGNRIGAANGSDRNVISGNSASGVVLSGKGTTENRVVGNYIGTDRSGKSELGNRLDGITVRDGASGNTIGGTQGGAGNVISGNDQKGVRIRGGETTENVVLGNHIGTDVTGTLALGNKEDGVAIQSGATANAVGGTEPSARNVISGNGWRGVRIEDGGTNENVVLGNHIGTDLTGTAPLGNKEDGVAILSGASGNTVGGTEPGARNVISGNGWKGVRIEGGQTSENHVLGNHVGTDLTGTVALGNKEDGVAIVSGASGNTIGGTEEGARNIISGNTGFGILISERSNDNRVQGNYIGTDVTGSAALGNGYAGVAVDGAFDNVIGGTQGGARNIISGNTFEGVLIRNDGTDHNRVIGNYIGTDVSGTKALGNATGVLVAGGASSNMLGGTTPEARNLISGNGGNGIELSGPGTNNNRVIGNFIGTDVSGTVAVANTNVGVMIHASDSNMIGGTEAGARNVISGNTMAGIDINGEGARDNHVQGNFIGTDATGIRALGNGLGVMIANGASENTIGGTEAGARNIISGNTGIGQYITSGANGNRVQGNYIGTDVTGSTALSNTSYGVLIHEQATENMIGGIDTGARNVISGNGDTGVAIAGSGNARNLVKGNYIGTDATGTKALGNTLHGIGIGGGSSGNTIGGVEEGARNIIAGNKGSGVAIGPTEDSSERPGRNSFQGNYIGTGVTGSENLGNGGHGLELTATAGNTIGGASEGAGNTIVWNAGDGISIADPEREGSTGNQIRQNSIRDNGGLGIRLADAANGAVHAPVIAGLAPITGTAPAHARVELFADDQDEGAVPIGIANADEDGAFSSSVSLQPYIGKNLTATATDSSGNTSEFSAPIPIEAAPEEQPGD